MAGVPHLYRGILHVSDLKKASDFYSKLLGATGRNIRGGRHYFDCGPVILALLNPTLGGIKATPSADNVYFSVTDLRAGARASFRAESPVAGRRAR